MASRSTILRIACLAFGAWLFAGVVRADSLTVTPGVYFVRTTETVEVRVDVDCPDMSFLTIDVGFDSSRLEFVTGSAVVNTARVDTTNAILPTFVVADGKLTFQADNLGAESVSAGTDWVFSFSFRGLAVGAGPLDVQVTTAETVTGYTPEPITVSGVNNVTVYRLDGLPPDPTNDTTADITVVGDGLSQYKYSLDGAAYSAATNLATPIAISGLAEGVHTLDVVVGDADGNWQPESSAAHYQWTVDFNVPDNPLLASATPVAGAPFNADLTSGVALTWTPEAGAEQHSYSWIVDRSPDTVAPETVSGAALPGTLAAGLFADGDGAYYLHLRTNSATDGSGAWSATAHFGPWSLDTQPPTASLLTFPPDPDNSISNVEFRVSAAGGAMEAVVAYKFRVDGEDWSNPVDVADATFLDGLTPSQRHTFEVVGQDAAGNWQSTTSPTSWSWFVDVTSPVIDALTTDPVSGSAFGVGDEAVVTVQTRTPATDTESAILGYSWALTRDDPNPQPGFGVTANELPATFDLNNGDGNYYLGVRAFDAAGNFMRDVFTAGPWLVDTAAPDAPVLSAVTSPINAGNVSAVALSGTGEAGAELHYTFSDAVGRTTVSGVSDIDAAGDFSVTDLDLSVLADGNVTVDLFVRDAAGNDSQVVSQSIAKDTAAPAAPALTGVTAPINAGNVTAIAFSGTGEAGAELHYSFSDGVGRLAVSGVVIIEAPGDFGVSSLDLSSLADGDVAFALFVRDAAGNDSEVVSQVITKDTVAPGAPTIRSFTDPVNASNAAAIALLGTAEPGATVHYAITSDAAGRATVSGTTSVDVAGAYSVPDVDVSGLADGTLTATVFARDAVGNDSASTTATSSKDTVAPDAPTILSFTDPINASNVASVVLSGTAEPDATVHYTITSRAGRAVVTGSAPVDVAGAYSATDVDVSGLADGTLAATLFARDAAGNDSPDATGTSTKDTVAPTATVTWRDPQTVAILFSEDVLGGETASNYVFDPPLAVLNVAVQRSGYVLSTEWQTPAETYDLDAAGVTDLAGNPIAGNVSVQVPVYFRMTAATAAGGIDLVLGVSSAATAGFDPTLDQAADQTSVYFLAAVEPDPAQQRLRQDFRPPAGPQPARWRLVVSPERAVTVELSWTPALVSGAAGTMSLYLQRLDNEQPVGAPIDMKDTGTATLAAGEYELALGALSEAVLTLVPGWNLIGIPVMTRQTIGAAFRTASGDPVPIGPLWSWREGAYAAFGPQDVLNPEMGAWVLATPQTAGSTTQISGLVADGVMELAPGWNLVSPAADSAAPTDEAIAGGFWRWDASGALYRSVPEGGTLYAGQAYWVYVTAPGLRLELGF